MVLLCFNMHVHCLPAMLMQVSYASIDQSINLLIPYGMCDNGIVLEFHIFHCLYS
jgi:hypothetical protein